VLAAVVGLCALADGLVLHVPHALLRGPSATDVTGVALAAAGVALLGLAAYLAFAGTRRRTKLLAIPLGLVAIQWVVVPLVTATVVLNGTGQDGPAARSLGLAGARDVTFPARDGTRLAAWWVPGRNGAAVILLHGSHGTRADTTGALRLLARAGYAVLAYDARGHGDSAGATNALGWGATDDLAGAVAFVRGRAGVDPRRVGALGLSMGGETALRAAAEGVGVRAVVADGAGASTSGDLALLEPAALPRSVNWTTMRVVALLGGRPQPRALADVAGRIRVPVLLIASARKDERRFDDLLRRRIGAAAQLWYVADAGHTQTRSRHPAAYARRVLNTFDAALLHP
jgi:pimeloyl-ACP methyl ester carboxylesterase